MIGAAPQVLAWIALMAVEGRHAPTGSAIDSPTLQLSSSYFQGGGAVPANRNALALVLTAQSRPEAEAFAWGASLGWIRLYQPGDGSGLATMHLGNALAWASYRSAFTSHLEADLGLGLSLGLT